MNKPLPAGIACPAITEQAKAAPVPFRGNKELMADAFASSICHELIDTVTSNEHMLQDIAENVFFEAPYIIFTLMEALAEIAAKKGIRDWRTHPPA
jgi:hypothetical protein